MNEIISLDRIRADAIRAAEANKNPQEACPYAFASPGARVWFTEYAKAINRLASRERNRAAAPDIGEAA